MIVMSRSDANGANARISSLIELDQQEPQKNDEELRVGEIIIQDGNFNWEDPKYHQIFEKKPLDKKKQTNYILKDINLHIRPGEFVAVIGKVGSGKSSLLLSIMDEMVSHAGSKVRKNGSIAYISQEAFLSNETI